MSNIDDTNGVQKIYPIQSNSIQGNNDLIPECVVCMMEMIEPKQLNCGHSLCETCVIGCTHDQGRGRQVVSCPQCRADTDVPPGGLKTNYVLKNMIAKLREKHSVPKIRCSGCNQKVETSDSQVCKTCGDSQLCLKCILYKGHKNHLWKAYSEIVEEKREEWNDYKNAHVLPCLKRIHDNMESVNTQDTSRSVTRLHSLIDQCARVCKRVGVAYEERLESAKLEIEHATRKYDDPSGGHIFSETSRTEIDRACDTSLNITREYRLNVQDIVLTFGGILDDIEGRLKSFNKMKAPLLLKAVAVNEASGGHGGVDAVDGLTGQDAVLYRHAINGDIMNETVLGDAASDRSDTSNSNMTSHSGSIDNDYTPQPSAKRARGGADDCCANYRNPPNALTPQPRVTRGNSATTSNDIDDDRQNQLNGFAPLGMAMTPGLGCGKAVGH